MHIAYEALACYDFLFLVLVQPRLFPLDCYWFYGVRRTSSLISDYLRISFRSYCIACALSEVCLNSFFTFLLTYSGLPFPCNSTSSQIVVAVRLAAFLVFQIKENINLIFLPFNPRTGTCYRGRAHCGRRRSRHGRLRCQ